MAVYAEDFGDQRCGRGPPGSCLPGERRRLWQVDEAGGGELHPQYNNRRLCSPASAPAQPDSNPRVTSTSAVPKEKAAVPPPPKPPKPSTEPDRGVASQTTPSKPARGRNCSLDDSEIPSYLNLAERYRNSGKYDSAIRNYNLVLGCQPGNRQAQAGLRTAEEMEKYSH